MKLPELKVGDVVLVGKWKNRVATIEGFGTDQHNQPTVKTDKGEYPVFKFRVQKLMKDESMSLATETLAAIKRAAPAVREEEEVPNADDGDWSNMGHKQNKHVIVVHQVAKTKWRVTYLNPQGGSFSNQDAATPEKGKMLGLATVARLKQDVLDHIKQHQGGKVPVYSEPWDFAAGEPGKLTHMGDFPIPVGGT